ncbi:MAG TPA: ATP-binding protein [Caulobacteraceae bacterium]|nr:ATP-binding protein [Caulobacteraceae bacterium]
MADTAYETTAPPGPFDVRAALRNGEGSQMGRIFSAGLFALFGALVLPWQATVGWLAAIVAWELSISPFLDWVTRTRSNVVATNVFAAVNVVGACLFHAVALAALATGRPIGVALGVTWTAGALMNNFVYYGAYPRLLWSCVAPAMAAAIAGPVLAFGPGPESAAMVLMALTLLVAVRQYAGDQRRLHRHLAEHQFAVADLERKLAVAVEASGDGLFEVDLVTGESVVSEGWKAMLGYGPADRIDDRLMDYVHPDDRPMLSAEHAAHFEGRTPHTTSEQRLLCKDGSYKWVLSRSRVVSRTEDGRPWKLIGTTIDISARKALEHQLEAARDAAEAANAAKSTFVANMSHEIRTPLNGVIGVAGALARTPLSVDQREMVDLVQSSAQILERLLSDILDQSKLEAGEFELQTAPFDLRAAVEAAAELMRPRAEDKGLAFHVEYGEAADGLFEGDAVRLRQIITNLAANAIKFTESGEVSIAVDAGEDRADGTAEVVLLVNDTGIGFDSETAGRLFGRFVQADGSISRRFGGTGLGLAISKALAERMGGQISARSSPGQGATFVVRLPLRRLVRLEDWRRDAESRRAEAEAGSLDLTGLRVLLAEDHPTNQRVAQLILEPLGVDLTIVGDGAEAIEASAEQPFDLVLMDMQMPRVDGLAATRAIRERERLAGAPRMPIVMLTANAMDEHRAQSADAGADGLIAKPVTPQSLVEGVLAVLAHDEGEPASARAV